jgi:hypothetical protein
VISTFQLPMTFADCAWDKPTPSIWANTIKINAGFGVIITACFDLRPQSISRCAWDQYATLKEDGGNPGQRLHRAHLAHDDQ